MTTYMNIALRYFENRCALSGERFESFGNGKLENSAAKNNLSAEHVVALCQGGDDIFPNLVPTVLQYNISKNGYYLLDWWTKQKDIEGKDLYSPYRLLKLINYMMKSIDARNKELNIKQYEKALLTPNEIDIFLEKIQLQDQSEQDNNKRKILSNTVTAAEEIDGKKFLTKISGIEGNIPKQNEQQIEITDNTHMMDIFLSDAIDALKKDKVFSKDNEFEILINTLESMYKRVEGKIPFEVETRNLVLEKLSEFGVEDNIYTVANEIFNTNELFKIFNTDKEHIEENLSKYFKEKENELALTLELSNAKTKEVIKNMPEILYNKDAINCIILYKKYISENIDYKVANKTYLQNLLNIKDWMEKNNTTRPPRILTNAVPEEEGKLGNKLSNIRRYLINPYTKLKTDEEKEEYKRKYPELEVVMEIVDKIDRDNISTSLRYMLEIKKWMEDNHTTRPPRSFNNTVPEEEGKLGYELSRIRNQLIRPYFDLQTEEEREEYKIINPDLETIMAIVNEIDKNNILVKEEQPLYIKIQEIQKWMEDNQTTKPPRCQNSTKSIPNEESILGDNLSYIRTHLIKPYKELQTEEEKNEFKMQHPELDDVMKIVDEIDRNNIKLKEDSSFYRNALKIKKWMEDNQTTKPPSRTQKDSRIISEEEDKLAQALANIRYYLIKPYSELNSEEDKENFKIDYPELEDVRDIIEEIDRNNVKLKEESSFYINALKIKKWMEDNQTTKPPRSQYKSRKTGENAVPIEEARLGDRLSDIKLLLISPYKKLENDEDKKDFKKEHPEIEDVLKIVEWMESHIPEKLRQAQEILEWMKKNNTTKTPRATIKINNKALKSEEMNEVQKEEYTLGNALRRIRSKLINPYLKLQTNEEREKYKQINPEIEDVLQLIEEIDTINKKVPKSVLIQKTVIEQKEHGLLGENFETENEFDKTVKSVEYKLKSSEIDK